MIRHEEQILAKRLGLTVHISSLRYKLRKLMPRFPSEGCVTIEDWLLDVANARGATIVTRNPPPSRAFRPPPLDVLSDEEMVVAICQLQGRDRPQTLRVAAQLISRGDLDMTKLLRLAEMERVGVVLAALAHQALHVDADHPVWQSIHDRFRAMPAPRSPILHWTRLANAEFAKAKCNAVRWTLTA